MENKYINFKTYREAKKSADYKLKNQLCILIGFGFSKTEKHFYILKEVD